MKAARGEHFQSKCLRHFRYLTLTNRVGAALVSFTQWTTSPSSVISANPLVSVMWVPFTRGVRVCGKKISARCLDKAYIMRQFGWLAAAAVFCAPVISSADFIINHTRTEGTGSLTGYHIYRFYAKNTQSGMHPTSTTLTGLDFTVQSLGQPFKFDLRDTNGDDLIDVNLTGIGQTDAAPTGTFMRIGSTSGTLITIPVPSTAKLESTGTYDAVAYYTGRTDFRLATVKTVDSRPDATTGLGARFAVVIVPLGSSVRLSGEVGDEQGVAGSTDTGELNVPDLDSSADTAGFFQIPEYIAQAPEPGALALLGVATVGICRRSRRRTI